MFKDPLPLVRTTMYRCMLILHCTCIGGANTTNASPFCIPLVLKVEALMAIMTQDVAYSSITIAS